MRLQLERQSGDVLDCHGGAGQMDHCTGRVQTHTLDRDA
jgi:hypothetical protein